MIEIIWKSARDRKCCKCHGSGKCTYCNGTGIITHGVLYKTDSDCFACSGYGSCKNCEGRGGISRRFSISARVRCPKCGLVKGVQSTHRPLRLDCDCGAVLILNK